MGNAKKHADFLSMMQKHKKEPKVIKNLLKMASQGEINTVCEIYYNTIKGNVRIPLSLYNKLKRHKKNCHILLNRKTPMRKKKKILLGQTGGFLPLLIGALAPVLGPMIKGVVKSFTG